MVRFKDYILAEYGNDFDVDKFYADCEPFIKEIIGIKEEFLPKHGTKGMPFEWEIRKVIARERPRDTPIELHDAINDYFKTRFGWRARSESIFTTGDYETAEEYGTVALCFPIGENYQTLWGEDIKDLYLVYERNVNDLSSISSSLAKTAIKETIEMLKAARWHHDKNLKRGYESNNEVMINVDKVYLIKVSSPEHEMVVNHLKSLKMITT